MRTTQSIQRYIQKTPRGKPFTTATLMQFGTRAAIDKTLSRLAHTKKITRLTRGIYVRPEENRFVGSVLPEPFKIAQVIAEKTNEIIQVSGAEAARQLGLSTQVPTQPIFLTTGRTRQFKVGNLGVTLKHVSRKKVPIPGSKAGLAISALWYLGKNQVTVETITKIQKKLTSSEFQKFICATEYMPGWMSNVVFQYKKIREG